MEITVTFGDLTCVLRGERLYLIGVGELTDTKFLSAAGGAETDLRKMVRELIVCAGVVIPRKEVLRDFPRLRILAVSPFRRN